MVELLVVIAIIAILAAMLLPSLSRAKAQAKAAQCKNNLRQVGLGLSMYTGDFGRYPYQVIWSRNTANPPISWAKALVPYTANEWTNALYLCPDYKYDGVAPWTTDYYQPSSAPEGWNSPFGSYGYNCGGTALFGYPATNNVVLGLGPQTDSSFAVGQTAAVRESQVVAPSDMLAVGDSLAGYDVISPNMIASPLYQGFLRLGDAHGQFANMVFCDAHVEWTRRENLYRATDLSRIRWNNDHQPHPETWLSP